MVRTVRARSVGRLREKPLFVWLSASNWAEGLEKGSDGKCLQRGHRAGYPVKRRAEETWGRLDRCQLWGKLGSTEDSGQAGTRYGETQIGGTITIHSYFPRRFRSRRRSRRRLGAPSRNDYDIAAGNDLLAEGKGDLILLVRESLRDPHLVLAPPMNWASLWSRRYSTSAHGRGCWPAHRRTPFQFLKLF